MSRRQGMEAMMGIGGGIVSAESQKNLEIGEDLIRKKKCTEVQEYLLKAMEDPNNLDVILISSTICDAKDALLFLTKAESRGRAMLKKLLGEDCFDDGGESVGKFWGIVQTRPYMRILQGLHEVYFEQENYAATARVMIEMMRLCPADNKGTRFCLGSTLIHCGRYADALYFSQQWLGNGLLSDEPPTDGAIRFRTPHRNTMAAKKEKNYEHSYGSLLYSAALASFKHFGDCEQSRQYLKIAAIAQPSVLVKILAKVQKPAEYANGVTSLNGPEEAQDYLTYAQDLWMKPDVWNWANENPDVKNAVLKICSRPECGVREIRVAEYKRCSACHLVSYCIVACQKYDWIQHKPVCLKHKREKAASRAFMGDEAPSGGALLNVFSNFVSAPR